MRTPRQHLLVLHSVISPRSPSLASHPCLILDPPNRLTQTPFPSYAAAIPILTTLQWQERTLFLGPALVLQQACCHNHHQRAPRRLGRSLCRRPGQRQLLLCHHGRRYSGELCRTHHLTKAFRRHRVLTILPLKTVPNIRFAVVAKFH